MARTKNFGDVIRAEIAADLDLAEAVEQESFNADIAQKVYELRTEVGLSQKQLAERINTHQSVISRIEDADYDGHSLSLLKKIASVFGKKLRVDFYARPRASKAVVTEFSANWQKTEEWLPKITQLTDDNVTVAD